MSRGRRSGGPQIDAEVSPNLIPMIDIMFLLLLFFMLGADMGHRELEEVALPAALSVKEDKEIEGQKKDRLMINIFHRYEKDFHCAAFEGQPQQICRDDAHWKIGISGIDFTDLEKLKNRLKDEADRFRTDGKAQGMSERRVMLRAEKTAPYGHIQDVMNCCVSVGIYQIECGAARPAEKAAGA